MNKKAASRSKTDSIFRLVFQSSISLYYRNACYRNAHYDNDNQNVTIWQKEQ